MFLQSIANCVDEIQNMTGICPREADRIRTAVLNGDLSACEKVTKMLYDICENNERNINDVKS